MAAVNDGSVGHGGRVGEDQGLARVEIPVVIAEGDDGAVAVGGCRSEAGVCAVDPGCLDCSESGALGEGVVEVDFVGRGVAAVGQGDRIGQGVATFYAGRRRDILAGLIQGSTTVTIGSTGSFTLVLPPAGLS